MEYKVCDDGWNEQISHVACKMLGFKAAIGYSCCASYGQGEGNILLYSSTCKGEESSILDCAEIYPYSIEYCYHSEDVGLECLGDGKSLFELWY